MKKLILTIFFIHFALSIASAQWAQVSSGMGNLTVYSLAYSGNNLFAGTVNNGVFLSTNNGANWTQTSLNNKTIYSLTANGVNVFAGTDNTGGLYMSTNNGTNWTQTQLNNLFINSLAVSGNNVFAATDVNGVYYSTNNGTNWTQSSLNNQNILSVAVNGNNVYAGIYNPANGVYLSTNNGANFTQTSLNNQWVKSLVISGNTVYAGTQTNGVFVSRNNGSNWNQTVLNNRSVLALEKNGVNIFAGTLSNGVYISGDTGTTWTQRNEGLGNISVWSFCILNNYVFAGATGSGVFRRPLSEITGLQNIGTETPSSYSLGQNYPNPFNPTTKIKFSLPLWRGEGGRTVQLFVYDVTGREVQTLVNESLQPGTYETTFDGSSLNSGVYFYKITAGDYSEIKRMVLLK